MLPLAISFPPRFLLCYLLRIFLIIMLRVELLPLYAQSHTSHCTVQLSMPYILAQRINVIVAHIYNAVLQFK
jgi:hypothetical protein